MDISNKELFKQQCFINGEWRNALNNETIDVNNPATQEIVGNVPKCGKIETNNAIKAANNSWNEWRLKTAKERSNILKKWFLVYQKFLEDRINVIFYLLHAS